MSEPNDSKPLASDQSKQSSSEVEDPTKFEISGCLVVEKDEPRRYKCEITLFNHPSKDLSELPVIEPLGRIKVIYISDSKKKKDNRDPIQLCLVSGQLSKIVFEDNLDDVKWKKKLEVVLRFVEGTIKYTSDEGEKTNESVQEWTLEIKDKPKDVLGKTYWVYNDLVPQNQNTR